jgi:ribosomal protein S18 acetylase RimI-like enzyme
MCTKEDSREFSSIQGGEESDSEKVKKKKKNCVVSSISETTLSPSFHVPSTESSPSHSLSKLATHRQKTINTNSSTISSTSTAKTTSFINSSALTKGERIKVLGRTYPIKLCENYQWLFNFLNSEQLEKSKKQRVGKKSRSSQNNFNILLLSKHSLKLSPNLPQLVPFVPFDPSKDNSKILSEIIELQQNEFKGPSELPIEIFKDFVQKGIFEVLMLTSSSMPANHTLSAFVVLSYFGHQTKQNLNKKNRKTQQPQKRVVHIEYLVVNPVCRGQGLGSLLCQLVVSYLKNRNEKDLSSQGPKFISLECEKSLIGFYSRFGWIDTHIEPCSYQIDKKGTIKSMEYHFMMQALEEKDSWQVSNKIQSSQCRNLILNGLDACVKKCSSQICESSLPSSSQPIPLPSNSSVSDVILEKSL